MLTLIDEWLVRLGIACIGGTVGIALVYLICRLSPRLHPAIHCGLWWLTGLKLLLGLVVLPAFVLPFLPATKSQPPQLNAALVTVNPSRAPTAADTSVPSDTENSASPAKSFSAVSSTEPNREGIFSTIMPPLLFGVYLLGIGIGIGAQAMALLQLRRLLSATTICHNPALEEAAQRASLVTVPTLRLAAYPVEPLTVAGFRRPLILIARDDLDRLAPTELLSLLTHECIHLKRGDLYLSLIPWLAQTLFWFFPPAYLAVREFQLAREAACDRQTVDTLALAPRAYGELLVKLSAPATPLTTPSSVMALSAGFHQLKWRIEMLTLIPLPRPAPSIVVLSLLFGSILLAPWHLTATRAANPEPPISPIAAPRFEALPNLDLTQGLSDWQRTAMGSDTVIHPYYDLGFAPTITHAGQPSAFIRSKQKSPYPSDGGVLRYDLSDKVTEKYRGKRLRFSAFIQGSHLTHRAFLFIVADSGEAEYFGSSPQITPASGGEWQLVQCVTDIRPDATSIRLGMRLEGEGITYGSGFRLEVVDRSVPITALETLTDDKVLPVGPRNLTFAHGLDEWWNDNPTHTADRDYRLTLLAHGGRNGSAAILLKCAVKKPEEYGTIGQNAAPALYRGKRIRFSAYLETESANSAELWMVVQDKIPDHTAAWNADSTGKVIRGTNGWKKIDYIIDIPETATTLSYGISLTGTGKVRVDGFQIEVLGPAQ